MSNSLNDFLKGKEVVVLDNLMSQSIGLMFHKKDKKVYLFKLKKETKMGIHGFFVFHKLHIYFFDKNKKLIEKTTLNPWKIYKPKKKFKYMIESFYELE